MKSVPNDASPPLRLLMTATRVLERAQPEWVVQAPGREMWLAAVLHDDTPYSLHSADADATTRFDHRSAKSGRTLLKRPLPNWARYPAGVIALLGDDGFPLPAFSAVLLGDEAAGPRYDFGLGLVMATFCHEVTEHAYTEETLVAQVERVRRDYIRER